VAKEPLNSQNIQFIAQESEKVQLNFSFIHKNSIELSLSVVVKHIFKLLSSLESHFPQSSLIHFPATSINNNQKASAQATYTGIIASHINFSKENFSLKAFVGHLSQKKYISPKNGDSIINNQI
jgi:hypothetical protein